MKILQETRQRLARLINRFVIWTVTCFGLFMYGIDYGLNNFPRETSIAMPGIFIVTMFAIFGGHWLLSRVGR